MAHAPAVRRPAARTGLDVGLRYVVIMLFALVASAGHAQTMAAHSAGAAITAQTDMAKMACCDDASGAAHATPACAAYCAPAIFQMAQPQLRVARYSTPGAAPDRHGLTWAPPFTPPRRS
ncbi:hypothetical protein [Roseovarius sp. M141]|uniref:hypothetical protein n=1 Tax=Roseovarius sp. M141 TaxID=2583806 RepID=UPI0020CC9958|nr:hypothetical protein [Roseovarius sp. M141]MCQ0093616.1 hypothetical protein [Roseovarius sp. M141]